MTWVRKLAVLSMFVAVLASSLIVGCSKFDAGKPAPNIPPETSLSFSPDQGGTANYRVRMNWFGWDEDGEVVYFETAWDKPDTVASWSRWIDLAGRRVVNTDSLFMLRAADEYDTEQGYAVHSFGVRAVDNDGVRDASPESLSFTAETALPETRVESGPSGTTGPMVRFVWSATDFDGVISYYYYRLFASTGGGQWVQVAPDPAAGSSIKVPASTNTVLFGPIAGLHKFEVWAEDDAGAIDQTPAVKQFTCNPELAGPDLTVVTNVFGTHKFRGPVWRSSYNIPWQIFNGERLSFSWMADASSYGGEVIGYRFAYDDTTTWPAWSMFDRRFSIVPTIGRHSLYVSALDNSNVATRARLYWDVVEASLNDYILVVDDNNWMEDLNPESYGSDEEKNSFYERILAGYVRNRSEWDPGDHIEQGGEMPPSVNALRGASTVLWYCDEHLPTITELFDPYNPSYNALAGYVRIGGNIILCGQKIAEQIAGETSSVDVSPADTTAADVFLRDFVHMRRSENSGTGSNPGSPWKYGYCMYGAIPTAQGEALGFEPVYVDTGTCGVVEGKWSPWYCLGGGYYHCGMNVDRYSPYQGGSIEIYGLDPYLRTQWEGVPIALLYLSGDNRGNACILGFDPYYCKEDQVKAMISKIMELFGEERVQGGEADVRPMIRL